MTESGRGRSLSPRGSADARQPGDGAGVRARAGPERVPVRDDLVDLTPYGAPQLEVAVRLNTNETAEPPPTEFIEQVRDRLSDLELNRYPDRRATVLRERVAAVDDLEPERVWVANGSNELLQQLLLAYAGPDRRVLLFTPGYSMYPLLTRVTLSPAVTHDLPPDFRLTAEAAGAAVAAHDPDVVLLAHPNNPTGMAVPHEAVHALHDAGDALIVVDEAYVEFGAETVRPMLDALPRLVVCRTFSKAYRLAGLRLGYLLAHDWVVEDLKRVRLPYHLDTLKQAAALAALDLGPAMLNHLADVAGERERLLDELAAVDGVAPYPSSANFVLFRAEADDLFDRLLDRDVLVRDFSSERLLDGCLRVTVGTREENDAFLDALRDAVG